MALGITSTLLISPVEEQLSSNVSITVSITVVAMPPLSQFVTSVINMMEKTVLSTLERLHEDLFAGDLPVGMEAPMILE